MHPPSADAVWASFDFVHPPSADAVWASFDLVHPPLALAVAASADLSHGAPPAAAFAQPSLQQPLLFAVALATCADFVQGAVLPADLLHGALADAVIAPEDLMSEARKLAETIASRGPEAIRFAKQAIDTGMREGFQAGLDRELALFGKCFTTADTAEGIDAFLSKRKADFQGK